MAEPATTGHARQLPTFDVAQFAPRTRQYCVAVFVIDEGERLHRQLRRMAAVTDSVDVVVADGGSRDGSTQHETLSALGVNTLLTKTGAGKLGAQMRMALSWALDRGYRGVVVVDGNDKDGVEDIARFTDKLQEGYDHVQGSRFIAGGHHERTPPLRLLGVKLLHAPMIRRASGFPYTDTTNGFRAYSRRLLEDPRIDLFRDELAGYELHYYLAIRAARLGLRCVEVPVTRRYPPGAVPTKISAVRGNLAVIGRLWKACRGDYDPPPPAGREGTR